MKNFKFYKQETNWTCGPAVARMLFESVGIKKSEKEFIKPLKSNKIRGTYHENFPALAEEFKLDYVVNRNSSIDDLKFFLNNNYIVMVCYFIPEEKTDHYSIVKDIDSSFVYFYDPYYGENHKLSLKDFEKNWKFYTKYSKEKRWFFGVKY